MSYFLLCLIVVQLQGIFVSFAPLKREEEPISREGYYYRYWGSGILFLGLTVGLFAMLKIIEFGLTSLIGQ